MRRMIQFSVLLITVFVMLIISCNMPQDPFKKPSNSKVRLFSEKNEQTIKYGSEVKVGVSIFLAEHIEALHVYTRNNGLDTIHPYSSNAIDDTLYFNWKFIKEGVDTIFVIGKLKDKSYKDKSDTLPIFILPAPDSIRFDSVAEPVYTFVGKIDTLLFVASASSKMPLSFSARSNPDLDSKEISVKKNDDTAWVIFSTDNSGEYNITFYAQRDTLIDSAIVNVTVYEPLIFENVILPDIIPFGKIDTLVFTVPTEREDTLTCKLLNEVDFAENELSVIVQNSDSLVIVFTPYKGGEHEFLLLLNNGKISDTLKYTVTIDDNPSVGVFIENHKDSVPFETPVNIGVSVFLPQLIEELHISTSDNSLDSALELAATDDTVYVSHEFSTEGEVKIYVTAKPVNSDYEEKIDSLTINVLPAPEEISFDSIPDKLHTVTGLTDTLLFLAKSSTGNALEFSVKSNPALDSDHLEVVHSNDTARVIVTTVDAGKYGITLYAKRDTLKDSARVDLISYEPLVFETVVVPDTIPLGSTDSLVFVVPTEREDTLTCKLLNENEFYETEVSVSKESAVSFVIVFTPETIENRKFAMLITNGHIKDTLNYDVFVSEKIPVWNITEKAIDAVEGEEVRVDLRDFINESFSGEFNLDSDLGEIEDTIWKWTPPWDSDTAKKVEISAVCDSDDYKIKLNVSITEGDTTGPIISLLHSSMNDTVIGASQIYVEAVVKDSGAGVSSVQICYGSKTANMALTEDSIYMGSVQNLKNGEKAEIKIVAADRSMRKNVTEYVFYVTYDSTIGDNVAPVISQESGPENGSRITDGQIQLSFSVNDDSGIDSVYWTLIGTYQGLLAQQDSIYSLSGTFDQYGLNEIEVFAVDKSINRNRSFVKLVYDYNTEITSIDIISPVDDISDVDTSGITFEWSGGNDEDGDTVFLELLYGTSKSNLNKQITGVNCSNLVLSEKLKSYTDYYWQVIAYSKEYPDTVKSSVYNFKTVAVPLKIISQPDKNISADIGERIVLRVNATGNPAPLYRWLKDGAKIKDEEGDSLVINNAGLSDSGAYVVEVYNKFGTENSNIIDLRIIYPLKVGAGFCNSLFINSDGTLFECGKGNKTFKKVTENVLAVSAGKNHNLVLQKDGKLLTYGSNSFGQLGDGTTNDCLNPKNVLDNVQSIAAGHDFSLIIKNNGMLYAFGSNKNGQLADSTTEDRLKPKKIMEDVKAIAAGGEHSLILKIDGTLYTCGSNWSGQLGDSTTDNSSIPIKLTDNVKKIAAGHAHSLILKSDGTLYACGFNYYGQLGNNSTYKSLYPIKIFEDVQDIKAGTTHSLILKNDGTLFACGGNYYGQLGDGTNEDRLVPVKVMEDVREIDAGDMHSTILQKDGLLFTCGSNNAGQLGDGTTQERNTPICVVPKIQK